MAQKRYSDEDASYIGRIDPGGAIDPENIMNAGKLVDLN